MATLSPLDQVPASPVHFGSNDAASVESDSTIQSPVGADKSNSSAEEFIKPGRDLWVSHAVDGEVYHTLDTVSVVDYVHRTLPFWLPLDSKGTRLSPGVIESSEEVGDGNLNLVFRLLDSQGRSRAVLKQSLPYVRCVGESWPLTLDRNRLEAETLLVHYQHCPETTEKLLFYSPKMAVMVLEDLSDCIIWRRELVAGRHYEHVAAQLGHYLADVLFHTSDFAQDPIEKKHAVQQVTNVAMCQITEDLFFIDPYVEHPRNSYHTSHEALIKRVLREDKAVRFRVAQLKHAFMTRAEGHLHGDLHSGSVFVDAHRVKAIDAEFGYYGPMGFDLGTVVGNLLMTYLATPALLAQLQDETEQDGPGASSSAADLAGDNARAEVDRSTAVPLTADGLLRSIDELWSAFRSHFLALAATGSTDGTFADDNGFVQYFLDKQVWADTVGFAGTEMIRRTVGMAHVADVAGIKDTESRLNVERAIILLGRRLILEAQTIESPQQLVTIARSENYTA